MAMPLVDIKETGKLRLTVFHYSKAGDELPVHVHDNSNNHITFVTEGRFRITGAAAIRGQVLMPGKCVDWPAGQEHGFVALEDNSRMIQVPK